MLGDRFITDRRSLLLGLGAIALGACKAEDDDTTESTSSALEVLYDTYAQALYLDGTFGPKTGIIRAADMIAGEPKTYDFWHGHDGRIHRFVVSSDDFALLRQKKRVTITTSSVASHEHKLFIDPVDLRWRVPNAAPVEIPPPPPPVSDGG